MRHPLVLTISLLFGVTFTWWLVNSDSNKEPLIAHDIPREIDYYLRGIEITSMDIDGEPARTLKAIEAKHYSDDGTTEMLLPRITIRQKQQQPWTIKSHGGLISNDGDLIYLMGEVKIDRFASALTKPFHLKTRNLRIQPQQDYAETDEKVRVRSNNDRIQATGMQAWLKHPSRIKFLSKVKGHYAPP